jgi:hypothetical protein
VCAGYFQRRTRYKGAEHTVPLGTHRVHLVLRNSLFKRKVPGTGILHEKVPDVQIAREFHSESRHGLSVRFEIEVLRVNEYSVVVPKNRLDQTALTA